MHKVVRGGVAVFAVRAGQILVGQRRGAHESGTWTVPGGWMEFGESIEDAASRELREETGLGIVNLQIAGVFSDPYLDHGVHCLAVWVVGDAVGSVVVAEPDKFNPIVWRNLDELPGPLMLAWDRAKTSGVYDVTRTMIEARSNG